MSSVTVARDRLTGYLMKGEAARFNDADFDQVLIHAMDMDSNPFAVGPCIKHSAWQARRD